MRGPSSDPGPWLPLAFALLVYRRGLGKLNWGRLFRKRNCWLGEQMEKAKRLWGLQKKKKIHHYPKEKNKVLKWKKLPKLPSFKAQALISSEVLQGIYCNYWQGLLFQCRGFKLQDKVKREQRAVSPSQNRHSIVGTSLGLNFGVGYCIRGVLRHTCSWIWGSECAFFVTLGGLTAQPLSG